MTTANLDIQVDGVLAAAVGYGLAGAAPWPEQPIAPDVLTRVLHTAREHRLIGALAEAVFHGDLVLEPEQFAVLAEYHASAQLHVLELERALLRVADVFADRGIELRVLKGLALSRTIYDDPAWRVASDVDLLIPGARFDDAVSAAVDELGGERPVAELRPGFDRQFGKEALIQLGNVELDLHRTLVAGPFGLLIDLDDFFADSQSISIGDRELATHTPDNQFLHACYNTALGDYPVRLCSVRDLLLSRARLDVEFDRAAVIATAARWHGTAVVQRAAHLVIETVGPVVAADFVELAALPVPRREQWLMRSYLTSARSYSRPLASLAVIGGLRPRLRYARAILNPSEAYLGSRGWTTGEHLKRAIDRLRRHG